MAYEVVYKYHERLEDGRYNNEEIKETKKNIGNGLEEYPLEKLAAIIMGQLARRDIWIVGVEINEFIKKKISFKEPTDGKGVVIKGKKFYLGSSSEMICEDVEDPQQQIAAPNVQPHEMIRRGPNPKPTQYPPNEALNRASNTIRPKSYMIFDPELPLLAQAEREKLKFKVGQKYPVYKIEEHPLGLTYGQIFTTVDDVGTTVTVSDKYFVPVGAGLIGEKEVGGFSPNANDIPLEYGQRRPREIPPQLQNYAIDDGGIPPELLEIPDIRRRM